MSDKFTRLGASEGDILYATSAGGAKSVETLEDNIDTKMLALIGADLTGGSIASSGTETVIATVTIAANSVNTNLVIMGSISKTAANSGESGTFRIRVGTAGTTADTQIGNTVTIQYPNIGGTAPNMGGSIFSVALAASDFTKTVTNYVTITGQNNSGSGQAAICYSLIVLGA